MKGDERRRNRLLSMWEDVRGVFLVEADDILGCVERAVFVVWGGQHGGDDTTGARPGDQVEIVGDPSAVVSVDVLFHVRQEKEHSC